MRISLRRCPPTSALFVDYLESWARVESFYSQSYSLESIERFARERRPLEAGHLQVLCEVLDEQQARWGGNPRGVSKLASGAVAVVTGQQPTLFTGPLFCIFKAISAIKIAEKLEQAGVRAVPVFWIAAEDHDFEEISSAWIIDRNSDLRRLSVDLTDTEPVPAGWLTYKEDVRTAVTECLSKLPPSEFTVPLQTMLESSYKPGTSPVEAFARMMTTLFRNTELTLVDPLNDKLKAIAQPIVNAAISRNSQMRSAIMARSRALTDAGYHAQVKVDDTFTGLFGYRGRSRVALRPDDLKNGVSWSPNVLLRPIVQDSLFPTAAYVAGPAEVAYFAQASAVYQTLERPMPPIFPRISATLIEPRIARIRDKYGLDLEDVFRGREHLRRKMVSTTEDDSAFDRVTGAIEAELNSLASLLTAVDETLAGALDTSRQKVKHQLESLHNKYINAVSRRNELLDRHLDSVCNSLFPEKKQQERVINISSLFARYGSELVSRLMDILSLDTREHQVVEL
ncbi:MAG TPA: bacillithiol biosynthesis BshC [Terriglobia bacterium]|nr:bacillithiol biosynthesis BshC [Terriglobia bacterium]